MRKREMETETETKNWKTKNQEMGDEGKHTMKKICYKMGIRHSIKDNLKNFADFYITCCIPVIPFSLSAHMLFYLSEESAWGRGGFVNCMLLLSGILLMVCLAVFRYSLKAYIRQKSGQYSILLMLGITRLIVRPSCCCYPA